MGKLGSVTAFAAEAALWITGAVLVANAAGLHWNVDASSLDVDRILTAAASASPSGSVSPTLAPGASPTTSPVGSRFVDFMARQNQTAATVWISETATAAGSPVDLTVSGTMSTKGSDDSWSYRQTVNGAASTYDKVDLAGTTYERVDGGAWTKAAESTSSGPTQISFPKSMIMVDDGVEAKDGLQLHRLELFDTGPFSVAFVQELGSGFTSGQFTLTAWTYDDGTPVVVEVDGSFKGTTNGVAMSGTLVEELVFTRFSGVTITAPASAQASPLPSPTR